MKNTKVTKTNNTVYYGSKLYDKARQYACRITNYIMQGNYEEVAKLKNEYRGYIQAVNNLIVEKATYDEEKYVDCILDTLIKLKLNERLGDWKRDLDERGEQ